MGVEFLRFLTGLIYSPGHAFPSSFSPKLIAAIESRRFVPHIDFVCGIQQQDRARASASEIDMVQAKKQKAKPKKQLQVVRSLFSRLITKFCTVYVLHMPSVSVVRN